MSETLHTQNFLLTVLLVKAGIGLTLYIPDVLQFPLFCTELLTLYL